MNHERDPLDDLFRADSGPSSADLAEARLLLKRALERERSGRPAADPPAAGRAARLRLVPRRGAWIASQACGFALLVALLVPVLPRLLPELAATRRAPDLVASLADGARSVGARLRPWLPSLPPLPELPLRYPALEMRDAPATGLFDWIPSLHSDAR
jgi:hypothetical protein